MAQTAVRAEYIYINLNAISLDFGSIFSDESLLDILNNCIPPTFIIGMRVIAITIIPIPPNHCKIALHNRIPLGAFSKLDMIVDPVVVIPDILSKKASVIDISIEEKINGKDPKTATLSQDKDVNKKACCKLTFLS